MGKLVYETLIDLLRIVGVIRFLPGRSHGILPGGLVEG